MRRRGVTVLLVALTTVLSGCSPFRQGSDAAAKSDNAPTVETPLALHDGSVALITPTAAPAHEEDRQALADIFTDALVKSRPDLAVIPLGKTLSAINTAGLAGPYERMYLAYKNTGLFDGQSLHEIAQAVGARYLVELKLGSFEQQTSGGMVSFLGLGLGRRATADLRLTLQIWDGQDGKIVWERSTEQSDTKRSFILTRTVKMADVEKSAADELIKQLPR
jgi:ABC-type uncharacterized transport system auxiliary subunit